MSIDKNWVSFYIFWLRIDQLKKWIIRKIFNSDKHVQNKNFFNW